MEITVLNKLYRKLLTACVLLAMLICVNVAGVSADEPVVTYGIEYSDNSATITFYTTIIDSFDIAVAYDPSVVSVSDCGYTTQFKELQIGGENTTISVLNDDAKDDVGNTYMVFTGAGADMTAGGPIDFAGKPLSYVTFEGDLANAKLTIVTDSAAASNVYEANTIGEVTLNGGSNTMVTPEPVDGVEYESPDSEGEDSPSVNSNDTDTAVENNDDTVSDNESVASTETDEVDKNTVTDQTESEAEENEASEGNEVEKDIANADDEATGNDSLNPVILAVMIVIVVAIIVAIIIVVIKRNKK